jgi:divalent metal cation (Fe/Co/Zn/Cd) transporter
VYERPKAEKRSAPDAVFSILIESPVKLLLAGFSFHVPTNGFSEAARLPANDNRTSNTVARRILRLQVFTIFWMTLEAAISLGSAWHSHSPALFAFGGDSLVELLSAAVVFWRFRFAFDEARAARIAGGLLFALAGLVVLASVLNFVGYRKAQRSLAGVGILLAAAVVMPWLGSRKRNLAAATSSAALKADAAESSLYGYMAWIALCGLAVNAIWHKSLADPVAALALIPLMLREGWRAVHASRLGCGCC